MAGSTLMRRPGWTWTEGSDDAYLNSDEAPQRGMAAQPPPASSSRLGGPHDALTSTDDQAWAQGSSRGGERLNALSLAAMAGGSLTLNLIIQVAPLGIAGHRLGTGLTDGGWRNAVVEVGLAFISMVQELS